MIAVERFVTTRAQRDQVLGAVMSKFASSLDVMNVQVLRCATTLTAPIVSV